MRRAISWILVAATLLGFVGMIAFSVFAEPYEDAASAEAPQLGQTELVSVYDVELGGLPEEIVPGEATAPALTVIGEAVVQSAQWVDTAKQPVKTLEDGKAYYLEVTLLPQQGYEFVYWLDVYGNGYADDVDVEDGGVMAKAWFRYSLLDGLGEVEFDITGLEVGTAFSDVQVVLPEDSHLSLDQVLFWDGNYQPVKETAFQKGKIYLIRCILSAEEGYDVYKWDSVYINDKYAYQSWAEDENLYAVYKFSTCDPVGTVELTLTGMEEGKSVSDIQLNILQGADAVTLDEITVTDVATDEEVDVFLPGKNYQIYCRLSVNPGYSPSDGVELYVNGHKPGFGYGSDYLDVEIAFSTCKTLEQVHLEVTKPQLGDSFDTVKVTGLDDTYSLEWYLYDNTMEEYAEEGVFEAEHSYRVIIGLVANEGYVFHDDTVAIVDGGYDEDDYYCSTSSWGSELDVYVDIDFFSPRKSSGCIYGTPDEIVPGEATIPELVGDENVTVQSARWVDADRNPVTVFEEGKIYYLEVTVAPCEGYAFRGWLEIASEWQRAEDVEIIDSKTAAGWFRYSLMPGVGDVHLTISGAEIGNDFSDLQAELQANANVVLDKIQVYDEFTGEYLPGGKFEAGRRYELYFTFSVKEGYDIEKIDDISVNHDEDYSWDSYENELYIYYTFSTCEPVGEVYGTVSGLAAGAPINGVKLELAPDAKVFPVGMEVYDCDTNEEVTSAFETGKTYQIAFQLVPAEGYHHKDGCEFIFDGKWRNYDWDDEAVWVYYYFSTCQVVDRLQVTVGQPQVGQKVDEVPVSVDGDVCTIAYEWIDYSIEEEVVSFQKEHTYWLEIHMEPAQGYIFAEDVEITVDGYDGENLDVYSSDDGLWAYVELFYDFRTPNVTESYVDGLPEELLPGTLTVPADLAVYGDVTLQGARWVNADYEPVKTAEEGALYYLEVTLAPAEGYVFRNWIEIASNLGWQSDYEIVTDTELTFWVRYSLMPSVGDISLTITGVEVGKPVSGVQILTGADSKVTVAEIEIQDLENYETVESGNFLDNHRYDVLFTLVPKDGYDIQQMEMITVNGEEFWDWELYEDYLVGYITYSFCEPVGLVALTSSGLEVGAPVSDVKLTVPADANVSLSEIVVMDYDTDKVITKGNFQPNRNYIVCYTLTCKEGYNPKEGIEVTLNGRYANISFGNSYVEVMEFFSTCQVIDKVELTVPVPQVGGQIKDYAVTTADGSYTVEYEWYDEDTDEPVDTFRDGAAYELRFWLTAKDGYIFDENTCFLLNGEEPEYAYVEGYGVAAYGRQRWSFKEKITKVELPALPQTISKGDTLPTEFTVADNANFTVSAYWFLQYEYDYVTKAEKDGVYNLVLYLLADDGYEFAEDAVVTIGGKVWEDTYFDTITGRVDKYYKVNVQEIDRIDITVSEPAVGATAKEPVAPEDTSYFLYDYWWVSNDENDVLNAKDGLEVFPAGEYIFLGLYLYTPEGYAFADEVAVYVNGKRFDSVYVRNEGSYLTIGVSFGKLQETGSVGNGDVDGLKGITVDDAIYLLQHVLMPDLFPVEGDADMDGSGTVDVDDAIYLLQHVLMPDLFPLK